MEFSRRHFECFLIIALCLLTAQFALGDNVYGGIRGVVTDPAGAAVPNITITATNTETGIATTTLSQSDGNFQFVQLPIGAYRVTAQAPNFKTFQANNIPLSVNQIYYLPIALELGATTETIEVNADSVQVETTNTQLQTLVDHKKIVELPLINRNWTALEQITPGVVAASDRFGTYSANGSQSNQSSYLINGVDSNDLPLNTAVIIPSVDALQEFNIITNTINPEYGRNSGAIVNAVIKSGTNQFHGGAFEFYRDTFLNTQNWLTEKVPEFHQNSFGATIGGPIWKDHTFFFFSFQGIRNRQPQSGAPSISNVFSNAQRNGDFSANPSFFTDINGDNPEPVGSPCGPNYTGPFGPNPLPFAVGTAAAGTPACVAFPTGVVGSANFNPIAANLLTAFIPVPNAGANQFSFNPTEVGSGNYQEILRVDHTFSPKDNLWGTMFLQTNPTIDPIPTPTTTTLPGFGSEAQRHYKQFIADWTHSFSGTTLNEFRLGYTRFNFVADQPQNVIAPSSLGFNINSQITSGQSIPSFRILGNYNFALGFTTNGPQPRKDQTYEITDNFSKIIGKHALKAGFDGRRFDVWNPFAGNNNGAFAYRGGGEFSTGDAGADFLLGIPDTFSQGSGGLIIGRSYEYYGYIQDQWKVRPNLSLTLGTGYQVDKPLANLQFNGLDVTCFRPGQQSSVFPNAPNGMLYPGDSGCNNTGGLSTPYSHFGPRVGFAWSPDLGAISGGPGKFSLRGGFGYYYNRTEEEGILQNLSTPPFSITSNGITDSGNFSPAFADPYSDVAARATQANPFPFAGPSPSGAPASDWVTPMSLNVFDKNYSSPQAMNFNLTMQREFASNTVLSVGYVGALGRHLVRAIEGNPITLAGQAACVADPTCNPALGGAGFTFQHANYPDHSVFPGDIYGSVGTQSTTGNSSYHALQVSINKGFSHGLGFQASYTYSHAIDDDSGLEDSGFNVRGTTVTPGFTFLNRGDSGYDARHRFVVGYTYQAPSLPGDHKWLNLLVGGWQLSGITTFQTGFPVTLTDSGFTSLICDAFTYYVCPDAPNQVASIKTFDPRNATINGVNHLYFDPSAFAIATPGTFGNNRRNSFHGPGLNNFDMAIMKNVYFLPSRETMYLQMRLEAYNVFNHTQFCNTAGPFPCIDGDVESGTFGQVQSVNPSRLVQLGVKFYF
jgi:Carboxypeptidase regulatory-like domain